ncbi:MAG: serine hydrolase domain-containing protein [Gemmatimonadota bacterium]
MAPPLIHRVAALVAGFIAVITATRPGPAPLQPPPHRVAEIPADIEIRLERWLRMAAPFGMTGAVATLRDTSLTLAAGFGPLRPDGGAIGPDTPFLLASLSKQFTATAILRSAADGHLALSDSLAKFFPDAPAPQRNITIEQLLTHTSGMIYLEPRMFDPAPDRNALFHELLSLPLQAAPGGRFSYSNPGYALLAGVLERSEQTTFEQYLTTRLFAPAGMRATTFLGRPVTDAPHGVQLGVDQGPMSDIPGADRAVGNGSVISTVRDLARWEVALRTRRILDSTWTEALFAPRVPATGGARYAFGWNILPTPRGTTLIFHAGDLGPFNTEFRRYVDDKFTLIWLSNARLASGGTREVVTRVVANLLNGAPVVDPRDIAPRDVADERRIRGHYLLAGGDTIVVSATASGLTIGATGSIALRALAGGAVDTAATSRTIADALMAMQQGDASRLRDQLHPSLPVTGAIEGTRQLLTALADSFGGPLRVEPLGGITGTPGRAMAFVRIRGLRGAVVAGFGLAGGGRILTFADPATVAALTPLKRSAAGASQYVAFDPATMRTTRITFTSNALSITVDSGTAVVATRHAR